MQFYGHPFSSYCQKALIALYENDLAFEFRLLARIGLGDYFERSLAARDAGMMKPDPRIFQILLESAGLVPEDVVHVGDDPDADVEGARAAGVRPIWLNREGAPWPLESPSPEITIATLDLLPDILRSAR
jgi:putative hydrolase of the HAD superfamily